MNFPGGSSRFASGEMWTSLSPRSRRPHGTLKISKFGIRSSSSAWKLGSSISHTAFSQTCVPDLPSPPLGLFCHFADGAEHAQLKRRGFIPNVRTYTTIMSGYATVDDWRPLTKQLGFVQSIYGQLKQLVEETRNSVDDPAVESDASYILYIIALYISILGKAGKYQKAFDVFHELDTDGSLAPHPKIYSSLLFILADRVGSTTNDEDPKTIENVVSDAKYVWRRQMRSLDKQPKYYMEPRSVYAMIKILSCSSQSSDHELMYDILRDTCGLPRPGEKKVSPRTSQIVSPTKWILQKVLDGCVAIDRPDMAVHYAQSVMDSRELRPILWPGHLSKFLRAHVLLARKEEGEPSFSRSENAAEWVECIVAQAPREQAPPHQGTLVFALELCSRCRDMPSAIRITRAIMDSDADPEGLPRGRSGSMPIKAWGHLFSLASVASPDEKRQCLELLDKYGGSVLDAWKSTSAISELEPPEKKALVLLALRIVKTLQPVPSSPDHEGAESPDAAEPKAWSDIRSRAKLFLKKNHNENPKKKG